ncbi:hypothetical protein K7432_011365 [Basidiobolus ranarum]|uniref:NADH:ubiquinone oxidoreductase intermediate-associated protein 30 domain-containing protein n=1 Tax=Basidiobolus ranarum TaxID=34480 RepID=A0ABR2VUE2_9FUNG
MLSITSFVCLLLLSLPLLVTAQNIHLSSIPHLSPGVFKGALFRQAPFTPTTEVTKALFENWDAKDFIAVDDRVRGGKSQSYLEVDSKKKTARFYGHLDIKTLGNAGFASQATKSDQKIWDLSKYSGIKFTTLEGDNKRYSISFKNTFLNQNPDGSQESALEYKYLFKGRPRKSSYFVKFSDFKPTYRGRVVDNAAPLNTSDIRVVQFQIASGFGQQQGSFSIKFQDIIASSL